MALLDFSPDDFLELFRNAARNRSSSTGGDDANNSLPPPLQQPPTQRAPFSFAGPDFVTQATAPAPPNRAPLPVPLPRPRPAEAPTGLPGWAQAPAITPSEGFPKLTAGNLTAHALRMKGVPEADIADAIGNPEKIRQLIHQNYGPRPSDATDADRTGAPSWQDIGDDVARSALSGLAQGASLLHALQVPRLAAGAHQTGQEN
jgi:hypothetical protein